MTRIVSCKCNSSPFDSHYSWHYETPNCLFPIEWGSVTHYETEWEEVNNP